MPYKKIEPAESSNLTLKRGDYAVVQSEIRTMHQKILADDFAARKLRLLRVSEVSRGECSLRSDDSRGGSAHCGVVRWRAQPHGRVHIPLSASPPLWLHKQLADDVLEVFLRMKQQDVFKFLFYCKSCEGTQKKEMQSFRLQNISM